MVGRTESSGTGLAGWASKMYGPEDTGLRWPQEIGVTSG